jgi:hypothetical protein
VSLCICAQTLIIWCCDHTILTLIFYFYYYDFCINTIQSFGSQQWNTSFSVQALLATGLTEEIGPVLAKGHDFIKKSQVCLIFLIDNVVVTVYYL